MVIQKTMNVSELWTNELQQRAVAFWRDRGFTFSDKQGEIQVGQRGSSWGNVTSYDMSKLQASLTILNASPTEVRFVMEVNTEHQSITEWNAAYWQLEMETAESYLLFGDRKEAEWQEFKKQSKRAAWIWTLTLGLGGRKIPSSRR